MLIFMSLSSCSNRKYEQTITRADNLMELSQDSARSALAILDSIRPDLSKMGKSTQMRYQLVYAKGMNKGYVDFTTDSLMKEIVDYYVTMTITGRVSNKCWHIISWVVSIGI